MHAAPSLFPRWGDGWALARVARDAGMAGVVIKFHHGSSTELASALDGRVKGLRVFGGLVLNYFVGGLNPYAVEAAVALGARLVWLPTLHASEHGHKVGALGGFGFQASQAKRSVSEGISIVDERGKLKGELVEILSLLSSTEVVLATGHVSSTEIRALLSHIDAHQLSLKVLVNHCFFHAPNLSVEDIHDMVRPYVWFEVADLSTSALVRATEPSTVAHAIGSVPDAQWVLVSDSGQRDNVPSPKALMRHAQALTAAGVNIARVRAMLIDAPHSLLGLDVEGATR